MKLTTENQLYGDTKIYRSICEEEYNQISEECKLTVTHIFYYRYVEGKPVSDFSEGHVTNFNKTHRTELLHAYISSWSTSIPGAKSYLQFEKSNNKSTSQSLSKEYVVIETTIKKFLEAFENFDKVKSEFQGIRAFYGHDYVKYKTEEALYQNNPTEQINDAIFVKSFKRKKDDYDFTAEKEYRFVFGGPAWSEIEIEDINELNHNGLLEHGIRQTIKLDSAFSPKVISKNKASLS